jgi:signal transduction histidine kinase
MTALFFGILFFTVFVILISILIIAYYNKLYSMRAAQEKLKAEFAGEVDNARNEIQQLTLNNISQEIHDNVGQLLSLAKMQLNLIAEKICS